MIFIYFAYNIAETLTLGEKIIIPRVHSDLAVSKMDNLIKTVNIGLTPKNKVKLEYKKDNPEKMFMWLEGLKVCHLDSDIFGFCEDDNKALSWVFEPDTHDGVLYYRIKSTFRKLSFFPRPCLTFIADQSVLRLETCRDDISQFFQVKDYSEIHLDTNLLAEDSLFGQSDILSGKISQSAMNKDEILNSDLSESALNLLATKNQNAETKKILEGLEALGLDGNESTMSTLSKPSYRKDIGSEISASNVFNQELNRLGFDSSITSKPDPIAQLASIVDQQITLEDNSNKTLDVLVLDEEKKDKILKALSGQPVCTISKKEAPASVNIIINESSDNICDVPGTKGKHSGHVSIELPNNICEIPCQKTLTKLPVRIADRVEEKRLNTIQAEKKIIKKPKCLECHYTDGDGSEKSSGGYVKMKKSALSHYPKLPPVTVIKPSSNSKNQEYIV